MLRKFVCVGFHSSQGDGAAVMRGSYENDPRNTRKTRKTRKKNRKNLCNLCNLWFLLFHCLRVRLCIMRNYYKVSTIQQEEKKGQNL
jgi:hypothetical protein